MLNHYNSDSVKAYRPVVLFVEADNFPHRPVLLRDGPRFIGRPARDPREPIDGRCRDAPEARDRGGGEPWRRAVGGIVRHRQRV